MSFPLPNFNLSCNIWRNGHSTSNPPDVTTVCALALGRRTAANFEGNLSAIGTQGTMWLLLPRGADIRDVKAPAGVDTVECPAGSSRFYTVLWVDDSGAGYANEHRIAELIANVTWPVPFPNCTGPWPPPAPTPPTLLVIFHKPSPTGGSPQSFTAPTAGRLYILMCTDWMTPGFMCNGNASLAGPAMQVIGSPAAGRAYGFSFAVPSGAGSLTFTPTSPPPSFGSMGIVLFQPNNLWNVQSDAWSLNGAAPTDVPPTWTGPPTNPSMVIAFAASKAPPAGRGFNSPYTLVADDVSTTLGSSVGMHAGYLMSPGTPSPPSWSMTPATPWSTNANGSIEAG